jgi:hypothetical protein
MPLVQRFITGVTLFYVRLERLDSWREGTDMCHVRVAGALLAYSQLHPTHTYTQVMGDALCLVERFDANRCMHIWDFR